MVGSEMANYRYYQRFTVAAGEAVGDRYEGMPLIGFGTPINGGVLVHAYWRQDHKDEPAYKVVADAIAVGPVSLFAKPSKDKDPKYNRYWEPYALLYRDALLRCSDRGRFQPAKALEATFDAVSEAMVYSENVDLLYAQFGGGKFVGGTPVNLSYFLWRGEGHCRHMMAAACWTLEQMAYQGKLEGRVTTQRSTRVSSVTGEAEGHAWGEHITPTGQVTVIDVAHSYWGSAGVCRAWDHTSGRRAESLLATSSVQPTWKDVMVQQAGNGARGAYPMAPPTSPLER